MGKTRRHNEPHPPTTNFNHLLPGVHLASSLSLLSIPLPFIPHTLSLHVYILAPSYASPFSPLLPIPCPPFSLLSPSQFDHKIYIYSIIES